MRFLSTLLFVLLATALAFGGTHRTHIVNTDDDTKFEFVKDSDGDTWAAYTRDGIRYVTTDANVLAALDKAMEKHRELSQEHSRLGREASRSGNTSDLESQQRALEDEQRQLEAKQRTLEDRQRDLEEEQHKLEAKQRIAEVESNRAIGQIFERAIREGKARRN